MTVLRHWTNVSVPLFNNARLFVVVASVIHSLVSINYKVVKYKVAIITKVMVTHWKPIS